MTFESGLNAFWGVALAFVGVVMLRNATLLGDQATIMMTDWPWNDRSLAIVTGRIMGVVTLIGGALTAVFALVSVPLAR